MDVMPWMVAASYMKLLPYTERVSETTTEPPRVVGPAMARLPASVVVPATTALPATIALPPTLAFPPMPAFPPTRMPSDDMCATQDAYFMAGHWCKDRFSADGDQETSQLRLPVLV